jgi:hypothetical protein
VKELRLVSWLLGALGLSFAGLQVAVLVLAFTLGRVGACKPIIESDGKAKHGLALDVGLHEPPNHWEELLGAQRQFIQPEIREGCFAKWTDEDPIMTLDNDGPKNGTEFVFWKAFTLHGKTTLGRYVADLWTGVSIGSGGALNSRSAWSEAGNIRLVERIPPPPQPAPPGFRAILPGECVFDSLDEKEDRVVGRFWIELPADRTVTIYPQGPYGPSAEMKVRLFYDDIEVPEHLEDEGGDLSLSKNSFGHFQIHNQGYYRIAIVRVDPPGRVPLDEIRHKNYTLQVYWSKHLSMGCAPPEEHERNCF